MQSDISNYESFGHTDQAVVYTAKVERNQKQCLDMHAHIQERFRDDPPGPLPEKAMELVRSMLANPTPDHELMRWELRLYCDHLIESTANIDNRSFGKPGLRGHRCTKCGLENQTVVASKPLGIVAQREQRPLAPKRKTPSSNRKRIADLEAEVESLRGQLENRGTAFEE